MHMSHVFSRTHWVLLFCLHVGVLTAVVHLSYESWPLERSDAHQEWCCEHHDTGPNPQDSMPKIGLAICGLDTLVIPWTGRDAPGTYSKVTKES